MASTYSGSRLHWWRMIGLVLVALVGGLFAPPRVAQGVFGSSGEGGCGNFIDAVTNAADGDVLIHMLASRNSSSAMLAKKLVIQGGWSPPTSGCESFNPSYTTLEDLLAAGFTFNGPAQRSGLFSVSGPVLNINPTARTLALQHLVLTNSSADTTQGGGINGVINNGGLVHLQNVVFDNDDGVSITNSGGGLYLEVRGGSRLIIDDSQFIGNAAGAGGGFEIRVYDKSEVIIRNTTVLSNTALTGNGGGGRILIESGYVTITDSFFSGNHADAGRGGGLAIERLGTSAEPASVLLINSFIRANSASQNRGLYTTGYGLHVRQLNYQVFVPLIRTAPTLSGDRTQITNIALGGNLGGQYVVDFRTFNFTPQTNGKHVHFFFNTVPPNQAGYPGTGPWFVYAGPSPFTGYDIVDRPAYATQLCILVANPDHSVQLGTGNCVDLP